jgi:hypothetical protein
MKPWHIRDPDGRAREIAEVEAKYPQLHASIQGERTHIAGAFPIREGATEIDHFLIEIDLPLAYPDALPGVREVGGRIPHMLARHAIPSSGNACVLLPDQRWELWPKGSTLLEYIEGPMHNYFVGQALVERGEPWPFGEWAHGTPGRIDYYKGLIGSDDLAVIWRYLRCLYAKEAKGHWDCPCMSGRRLRHCHFDLVKDLRAKIPRQQAGNALVEFARLLEHAESERRRGGNEPHERALRESRPLVISSPQRESP